VELEPQPGRRRQWLSTAIAAVVVLGIVAALLVTRGSDDTVPPTTSSVVDRLARGTWREIDAGPARGLENVTTIWTGHEVIVWGDRGSETSEGAAYDPSTGKWRKLAPSGLGLRPGAVVRWLGDMMLVWGGWDPAESRLVPSTDVAAYTPTTDTWRRISGAPFGPSRPDLGATTAVWTGRLLIMTNPLAPQGPAATAYDPKFNSWVSVPDPPVSLANNESLRAVWTGHEVVYVVPSGTIADRRALSFDPERHSWTEFSPPFPVSTFGTAGLVRAGDSAAALEWNATAPAVDAELRWSRYQVPPKPWVPGSQPFRHPSICAIEASPIPRGAAVFCSVTEVVGLDLANNSWRRFPAPPAHLSRSMTWTGKSLVAFSGDDLLLLDPARS
jgi:hypothetical protein